MLNFLLYKHETWSNYLVKLMKQNKYTMHIEYNLQMKTTIYNRKLTNWTAIEIFPFERTFYYAEKRIYQVLSMLLFIPRAFQFDIYFRNFMKSRLSGLQFSMLNIFKLNKHSCFVSTIQPRQKMPAVQKRNANYMCNL